MKDSGDSFTPSANYFGRRWIAPLLLIGGLGVILYTTLKEFDFQYTRLSANSYLTGFQFYPSSFYDFPRNILLFMPFGFGLAALFDQRGWSKRPIFLLVSLFSFGLTLLVESLQYYLPGRTPNLSDLLANSLGGLAGLGCYLLWRERRDVSIRLHEVAKVPAIVLTAAAVYMLLLLLLGFYLQYRTQFTGWDDSYFLLVGNERTGDRPWRGTVSQVMIFDQVFTIDEAFEALAGNGGSAVVDASLVAYYPLDGSNEFADRTGNLPDLIWQEGQNTQDGKSMWLQTLQPAQLLSRRLQELSQFTILLTLQTAEWQQGGPARILSFSQDTGLRNFTLGQEGKDLVLRVRSPMSGENGAAPEFVISDFLDSLDAQSIAVSFDGLSVTAVSADGQKAHKIEVVPGISLLRTLRGDNDSPFSINATAAWGLQIVFYLIFFIPLGLLLHLLLLRIDKPTHRLLIFILGAAIPPLLLELVLSIRNGFEVRNLPIILGSLTIGLTVLLLSISPGQAIGLRRTAQP